MGLITRILHNPLGYLLESRRIASDLLSKRKVRLPSEIRNASALSAALEQIDARLASAPEPVEEAESPVFIFSAGWRSGSTLLQRLLVSSGELLLWGEPLGGAGVIPYLAGSLTWINSEWPPDVFMRTGAGLQELSGSWIANMTPPFRHMWSAHQHFLKKWLGVAASEEYGATRWGLKEVRLTIDHARYLKWLFPRARFVFIYRDLSNAYRSWKGNRWDNAWPNYHSRSPVIFARHWRTLLSGYLDGCNEVDGMMVKYEDLVGGKIHLDELAQHCGLSRIDSGVLERRIASPAEFSTGRTKPRNRVAAWENLLLKHVGGELYSRLYP